MTKEQRKIKELTAQVANLTEQLEETKSRGDRWYDDYSNLDKQLEELHMTFDLLNVPRKTQNGEGYTSTLSLSNRMTLYIAGVRDTVKDKEQ